jgi:hypothetical protein
VSSKPGTVEYALVIGLLAEPVLIPGPMGMAPMVLVVIWEPVGMALVVVVIRGPVGMAIVVLVMADLALVVMFEVVLVVVVMALMILEPLVVAEPKMTIPLVKME